LLHLGIDVRPAHLQVSYPGGSFGTSFVMNADVLAAYQAHDWTLYGEVGHRPKLAGGGLYSYEYWAARKLDDKWSVRFGRFLPAYGVRFADHTSLNRNDLGFDKYDQVYGVEVSEARGNHLLQISGGPGRAEAVLHEQGRQAFSGWRGKRIFCRARTSTSMRRSIATATARRKSSRAPRSCSCICISEKGAGLLFRDVHDEKEARPLFRVGRVLLFRPGCSTKPLTMPQFMQ